jgi:hypothetical protein
MVDYHRALFGGHKGYYNPSTGYVRFGKITYPNIATAINHLSVK